MKFYFIFLISSISLFANASDTTRFKLEVLNIDDAGKYRQLVEDAISLLNEVFNSQEFKNEVLYHDFDWTNLASPREDSVTNEKVFDSLFRWTTEARINLRFKHRGLRLGTYFSGTAGTTRIGGNTTITYIHWLDLSADEYQCTLLSYASHVIHEYSHQRSFWDKDVTNQSAYRHVVPYAIGDIVCRLLNRKFSSNCNCNE